MIKHRPEYNKKQIGANLRRFRQLKNLSVEQVKEYLRLGSTQAIYKWEEGKSFPQTDTMFALMELYEIGLQELLSTEKEEQKLPEIYVDWKSGSMQYRLMMYAIHLIRKVV